MPHSTWAVAVEDVVYWLGTAFLVFQLLYRENDGAVRGYALLAVAVGMLLYHQTFSNWLVSHIAGVLSRLLELILKPFGIVFGKIVQAVRMVFRFYKKKLKKQLKEFIIFLFS